MFQQILSHAWVSALHMTPYLAAGIVLAAAIEAFLSTNRLRETFARAGVWPVVVAAVAAVTTPLCSCTTVAVMIPLLAAGVPWGPVMAWLVASPMNDPAGFVLVGGTLGWDLAWTRVLAALTLGIGGGLLANRLQRSGRFKDQSRVPVILDKPCAETGCAETGCAETGHADTGCTETACAVASAARVPTPTVVGSGLPAGRDKWLRFTRVLTRSVRQLVPVYALFLLVAASVRVLVPTGWVMGLFGRGTTWGIPVAAFLGMPLYTSCSATVPLVSSLLSMGMGRGAAAAFLLTGPGTSLPAMGALLTIARHKIVALYLVILYLGAVAAGFVVQALV